MHRAMKTARFSRREAMERLAVGAAATTLGIGGASSSGATAPAEATEGQRAGESSSPGYIDAHVHVWTDDTDKYPLATGFKKSAMKPPRFTPEDQFAHAKPLGVARVVLIQMSYYGYDNRYMLAAIATHRGVFRGVAVIDPADRPAETMRTLKKQGVRGFRIVSDGKWVDEWLSGDGMGAMWKCGAEEGLAMCHLINPDALPSVDRMCAKFPDTPVVIDHFARIGMKGAIAEEDLKNLVRLARHKQVSVKVSAFYALGKKRAPYDDLQPMIRRLVDAFGVKRLMWATDCPFQVEEGHTYRDSLALVRDRLDFLSADERRWLLRGTAERVFFGG